MIALDTNVLARYVVRDVPEQAEAARKLIESLTPASPGYIPRDVAIELVFVLERFYRFQRLHIAERLDEFLGSDSIQVQDADEISHAIGVYIEGGPDFADVMILLAAQWKEALPLHTFDRRLARLNGVTLIAS